MNWNSWIRQFHRWVSIAFTLTVIANFVVLGMTGGRQPPRVCHLFAAAAARLAPVHGAVLVRAAVYHQIPKRAEESLIVMNRPMKVPGR